MAEIQYMPAKPMGRVMVEKKNSAQTPIETCGKNINGEYQHSLKRRLVSGTLWVLGGQSVTVLASLTISVLLARLLSPGDLGVYFLIVSLVSIVALVAQLGLNRAVVQLVAGSLVVGDAGRAKAFALASVLIVAASAFIVALVLVTGAGQWIATKVMRSPGVGALLGFIACWMVLMALIGVISEIFRGYHEIHRATFFSGSAVNLLAAFLLLGFWFTASPPVRITQILVIMLLAAGVSAVLASAMLWKNLRKTQAISPIRLVEILRPAWPMFLTTAFLLVVAQADLWILGRFRPHDEVAIYGAAARLVLLLSTPLVIVNSVVQPLIIEMYLQKRTKSLEIVLRTASVIAGIPALLVLSSFLLFGDSIMRFVYGEYYVAGYTVLAILALGNLATAWAGTAGIALMMTGHQLTMMAITLLTGGATILFALFLVTDFGAIGVAVATALGVCLQYLAFWLAMRFQTGVWTHMGAIRRQHLHDVLRLVRVRAIRV